MGVLQVILFLMLFAVALGWVARHFKFPYPIALVIGGALGNLIDRLRFGHVVDFIQVYHGQWFFPAFNVADSAISVGAALLVWFGLFARKHA